MCTREPALLLVSLDKDADVQLSALASGIEICRPFDSCSLCDSIPGVSAAYGGRCASGVNGVQLVRLFLSC